MSINLFGGPYPELLIFTGIIWLVYAGIVGILYALRRQMDFRTSMVMLHAALLTAFGVSDFGKIIIALAFLPILGLFSGNGSSYGNQFYSVMTLIMIIIGIFIGYIMGRNRPKSP